MTDFLGLADLGSDFCTCVVLQLKIKTSGVVLSDIPSARASSDAWRMLIFSHLSSLTLCHDRMEGEVDFNVCLRSEHCSLVSGAANIVKILGLPAG